MRTATPFFIVLVLASGVNGLLGCGSGVEPTGTGGSQQGGSGAGAGGSGATGATGSTGGTGGAGGCAACDPDHEACVDEACVAIRELTMTATASWYELPVGDPLKTAVANACARPAAPIEPALLAEEGPCRVFESTWPEDGYTPDAGNLTAGAPSLGLVALTDPDPATAYCQWGTLDDMAVFETGENITLQATGGPMFAAFSHEVPAPEMATVTAGALQRGDAYTLSWTSSAPQTTVIVKGGDSERVILCEATGLQTLTIPGTLTELLPEVGTQALVVVSNTTRATHELDALSRVTVVAGTSGGRLVNYTP